ncbi:MAG: prepilin-type N-terminal cleavage/methylation domain-containing protein [Planctomycetota bacterium]|nr:MAG: prepilin-type N-terminal cleavage/methylation domain-containing protein [Planctomycetota bacterium]
MYTIVSRYSSRGNRFLFQAKAFTLIEVLVVVAIIALLAAILVPSLQRAREQARIAACAANCRQIGMITANYQAGNKDYVPVIYNAGAAYLGHFSGDTPYTEDVNDIQNQNLAQHMWLPVAFRDYDKGTRNLKKMFYQPGDPFDPELAWPASKMRYFVDSIMPDYYACPFVREALTDNTVFEIVEVWQGCDVYNLKGRICSYNTWQWEGRVRKGHIPPAFHLEKPSDAFPFDSCGGDKSVVCIGDGRPKYSALSWNKNGRKNAGYTPPPWFVRAENISGSNRKNTDFLNRKWTTGNAQFVGAASVSETTVIHCHGGMNLSYNRKVRNRQSHRTSQGGGTNAVFADSHVEWVKGTQIGWQ